MKGYVIIDTEVIDPEAYSGFVDNVLPAIATHGGRFLVRTSDAEAIEGDWAPKRLVILEFDDLGAARGFVDSAGYGASDGVRGRGTRSRVVVAEGYDSGA